jgi:hypothetical protein
VFSSTSTYTLVRRAYIYIRSPTTPPIPAGVKKTRKPLPSGRYQAQCRLSHGGPVCKFGNYDTAERAEDVERWWVAVTPLGAALMTWIWVLPNKVWNHRRAREYYEDGVTSVAGRAAETALSGITIREGRGGAGVVSLSSKVDRCR